MAVSKADEWIGRADRQSALIKIRGHRNLEAENLKVGLENLRIVKALKNVKSSLNGIRQELK